MRAWIRFFRGVGAPRPIIRPAVEFRRFKAVDRDSRHRDEGVLLRAHATRGSRFLLVRSIVSLLRHRASASCRRQRVIFLSMWTG
jgi:hypothetical protein